MEENTMSEMTGQELAQRAQSYVKSLQEDNPLQQTYQKNPYAVLAGAAGIGYLLGGGLRTPFTRRIVKMGMRAVLIPLVATQVKAFIQPQAPSGESR